MLMLLLDEDPFETRVPITFNKHCCMVQNEYEEQQEEDASDDLSTSDADGTTGWSPLFRKHISVFCFHFYMIGNVALAARDMIDQSRSAQGVWLLVGIWLGSLYCWSRPVWYLTFVTLFLIVASLEDLVVYSLWILAFWPVTLLPVAMFRFKSLQARKGSSSDIEKPPLTDEAIWDHGASTVASTAERPNLPAKYKNYLVLPSILFNGGIVVRQVYQTIGGFQAGDEVMAFLLGCEMVPIVFVAIYIQKDVHQNLALVFGTLYGALLLFFLNQVLDRLRWVHDVPDYGLVITTEQFFCCWVPIMRVVAGWKRHVVLMLISASTQAMLAVFLVGLERYELACYILFLAVPECMTVLQVGTA